MGILQRTKRSMVRIVFAVQLLDKKRHKDLVLMLDLNKTIVGYGKQYGHALRKVLE